MRPPRPPRPRRFKRDYERDGHHKACPAFVRPWARCECDELDEAAYEAACERSYDAWVNGDYDYD